MDRPKQRHTSKNKRSREHLRLVAPALIEDPPVASREHRSIGRLIAQTALIADTARARSRDTSERSRRRLGWFL